MKLMLPSGISRRTLLSTLAALAVLPSMLLFTAAQAQTDPLSFWNDGPANDPRCRNNRELPAHSCLCPMMDCRVPGIFSPDGLDLGDVGYSGRRIYGTGTVARRGRKVAHNGA